MTELNVAYSGQYLKYPSPVKSVRINMGTITKVLTVETSTKILYSRTDRIEFLIPSNLYSKTDTEIVLNYEDATTSPPIPVDFYAVSVFKPDASISNLWPLMLKQGEDNKFLIHNEFFVSANPPIPFPRA